MDYTQLQIEEINKAQAIKALAKGEGRAVSAEELTKIDEHLDKADEHAALAVKQKASDARLKAANAALDTPIMKTATQVAGTRVEVGPAQWEKDPNFGYHTPAIFMKEVWDVEIGRAKASDPLNFLAVVGSDEQSTIDDPSGGFLVPRGFLATLLKVDPMEDPTAGRTMEVPMGGPIVDIPARTDKNHTNSVAGGVRFFRKGETSAGKSSKIELEQVTLKVNTLFGLSFETEEIITDSAITFASIISQSFNEAHADKMLREKIDGTGVGQLEGVTNSGSFVVVPKEIGQTATTIVADNIRNMRARSWGYNRAIWMANLDTLPQISKLSDGDGRLIWQPRVDVDHPDMLMGRPIFFTEYTETLGQKNDIILCDWSQMLLGTLQPMQTAESMHVRFVEHERVFKFWERNDGRAWWKTPLTPVKGAKTLSPFIGLALRA